MKKYYIIIEDTNERLRRGKLIALGKESTVKFDGHTLVIENEDESIFITLGKNMQLDFYKPDDQNLIITFGDTL